MLGWYLCFYFNCKNRTSSSCFLFFSHTSLDVYSLDSPLDHQRNNRPISRRLFLRTYLPLSHAQSIAVAEQFASSIGLPHSNGTSNEFFQAIFRHVWHYVYNASPAHHRRLFFHLFCFIIKLYLALENSIWIPEQGAKSQTN